MWQESVTAISHYSTQSWIILLSKLCFFLFSSLGLLGAFLGEGFCEILRKGVLGSRKGFTKGIVNHEKNNGVRTDFLSARVSKMELTEDVVGFSNQTL